MNEPKRIYIAGPMSGYDDFNFGMFNRTETQLRSDFPNAKIVNPAKHFEGKTDLPWEVYLAEDIKQLVHCDCVCFLPMWRNSTGASIEHLIASSLDMHLMNVQYDTIKPDEQYLPEARELVLGDRQSSYGHPYDDFSKTAGMWDRILDVLVEHQDKPRTTLSLIKEIILTALVSLFVQPIKPEQVALAMICVKISRQMHKPKRDNLVDICGYALTIKLIRERLEA